MSPLRRYTYYVILSLLAVAAGMSEPRAYPTADALHWRGATLPARAIVLYYMYYNGDDYRKNHKVCVNDRERCLDGSGHVSVYAV